VQLLEAWRRLNGRSYGRWWFARLACRDAPYLSSIRPRFRSLRPGLCSVSLSHHRDVLDPAGMVHAMALANLCELAARVLMQATVPEQYHWTPRGMTIEYLAAVGGDALATARLDRSEWGSVGQVGVPVTVVDANGREAVRAVISMAVGERRS
jgi:acyl-coenzyme A thioesterase PaaI-like protein